MDLLKAFMAGAALVLALAPDVMAQDAPGEDTTTWHGVVLPQTEEIAALVTGVAVGPDSIVAVGQRACERKDKSGDIGRCWGQPWISTDGVSWEAVEARTSGLALGRFVAATSGPLIGIEGIAYGPGGYVAFGWAKPVDALGDRDAWFEATLWRSHDGRDWERIPTPASFSGEFLMLDGPWLFDIAGNDGGYLLVGTLYAAPAPRAAIWSSTDGLTWTLTEGVDTFAVGAYVDTMEVPAAGGIAAVAVPPGSAGSAGAIAVGSACPAGEPGVGPRGPLRKTYEWTRGSCTARYWQTDDGVTWQALPFEASEGGALPDEIFRATDVAASDQARVVGADPRLVLYSEDGSSWGAVIGDRVGRQKALATDGSAFHAIVPKCLTDECRRSTLQSWSSANGATWELGTTQPTMPSGVRDFIEIDAAGFGDRVLVTAGFWTAPSDDLASMVLLSPPLATPAAGHSAATSEPSKVPDAASAAEGPDAPVIALPTPDTSPASEAIAPPAAVGIAWVAGADTGSPAIHVTDVGGGDDPGPLLDGESPSWAPDGQRLAYTCGGSDQELGSICISSLDQPTRSDVLVKQGWRPRWSPDGSAVAFSRSVIDLGDAWVRDVDGHVTSRLPGAEPEWSPTGEWVLVRAMDGGAKPGASDLAVSAGVVRPDGSDPRVLGSGWNATWSPDGTKVASTRSDDEVTTVLATDIASGASEELFAIEGSILSLAWPTDDTMAVVTEDTRDGNLYAIDLRDKTATSLTPEITVFGHQQLATSPDGQWLAFSASADESGSDIYLASLDGGWFRLTANGKASSPAWRPEVMPVG